MGDSYAEVIVRDEKDIKGIQFRIIMIVITIALIFYGAMWQALILMLGFIMIPVDIVLFLKRCREYEYLLVSEELDITLVKNRKKRKKLATYSLTELQCMAPIGSHHLDGFHGNPALRVYDYSSGNREHNIYGMIFSKQGQMLELKVEPTQTMLNEVKMRHASVVHED